MPDRLPFHKSLRVAVQGVVAAVATERNVRLQLVAAVVVISAGLIVGLTDTEWALIFLCIGSVLSAEIMNTAIEVTVDLLEPNLHDQARQAKDLAAGSVLIISLASVAVALAVFCGHLL